MRRLGAIVACVAALLLAIPLAAQDAGSLRAEATRVYSEQGASTALPIFQRALDAYRTAHDRHGEAITLGLIGNCYKKLGDYAKALDYLDRALKMKRELGDRSEEGRTLNHLGLVYWETADYPKAIDVLQQSIAIAREIHDDKLQGSALNNLSLVYDEMGDYRRSLEQYQQSLALQKEANYEQGQAEALGNIGGVYLNLGHFKQAAEYYRQAMEIDERLKLKTALSDDLGNLASCQAGMGQTTEALAAFDRALKLATEAGAAKEEADWLRGKAALVMRMGRYDAAREYYAQALAAYERHGMKRELLETLSDEGSVFATLGDVSSAERDFQRAIDLARAIHNPRGVHGNSLALAELLLRSQIYDKAAAAAQSALDAAAASNDNVAAVKALTLLARLERDRTRFSAGVSYARRALEQARATESPLVEAQALQVLGEVERSAGDLASAVEHLQQAEDSATEFGDTELRWESAFERGRALEALNRRDDAVTAYRTAVNVLEDVRDQLRESRFRTGFLQDRYEPYVALVRLLLSMGRVDEAFLAGERLRSQTSLRQLGDELGPEGAELRERILRLQQAIDLERSKPRRQQRGAALDTYSSELASAQRQFESLVDDARARHSPLVHMAVAPAPEVEAALPPHAALVDYIVGADSLNIFVVTRRGVQAVTKPVRAEDLRARVELFRKLLAKPATQEWQPVAAALYEMLLGEAERRGWLNGVTRLYIAPHDVLHYVPFAALRRASGRVVVEDYAVTHVPTGAALVDTLGDTRAAGLLAVAPARTGLVYAAAEARGATRAFSGHSALLVGARATETSFKRIAGDYDVLHLATHGYFNRVNPMFSAVELEPDAANDGRLEVHEILNLRLHARLVTLSACETALGSGIWNEYPAGDEFVSLTRAFLDAGSRSVMATLWKVDDRSTSSFMSTFYRSLDADGGDAALAGAQRALLHSARYRHPFYWAAFVLIEGKADSPPGNDKQVAKKR